MPSVRPGPSEEKGSSLLPSHATTAVQGTVKPAPPSSNDILEASYNEVDTRLLQLEEELDVLLHSARSLREQRAKMTLGRLKHSEDGTTTIDEGDQFIDEYLTLAAKGKAVDDMIKSLKEECAASRSECNYLLAKIHSPSAKLRDTLRDKDGLANGRPESGFVDREAIADRIIHAESTATNVARVVGAFGAGITYTTMFSAARGRLDLIAWAFTCFLIVVIDSTALQVFALPRHGQLTRIFRTEYPGSVENRLLIYMVLVGAPLIAGFILLGVSVAVLDNQVHTPVLGSRMALKASGYLPVAILGYFVITIILVALGALTIRLLPRRFGPGSKDLHPRDVMFPGSILFPLKAKLHFLPGGPGYVHYRKKRLDNGGES